VFSLREDDGGPVIDLTLLDGRCGVYFEGVSSVYKLAYLSGVVSGWTSMDREVVEVGLLRFLSTVVYLRVADLGERLSNNMEV
jgi:hypothetical protein